MSIRALTYQTVDVLAMALPWVLVLLAESSILTIGAWVLWIVWMLVLVSKENGTTGRVGLFVALMTTGIYLTILPSGRFWSYVTAVTCLVAVYGSYTQYVMRADQSILDGHE